MPVMSEERAKREGREHVAAYRVTRSEAVELAEFTRLPELLGTLFAAGVDEVGGVEWISDRAESLYRELLGKAMVKAREKAECLAKAAGAQLGPIIHIQEGGGPVQPVARFQRTAMGVHQGASAPVPISGGEMKVRASVQAIYRLW